MAPRAAQIRTDWLGKLVTPRQAAAIRVTSRQRILGPVAISSRKGEPILFSLHVRERRKAAVLEKRGNSVVQSEINYLAWHSSVLQ
jgi:hypothetical protein